MGPRQNNVKSVKSVSFQKAKELMRLAGWDDDKDELQADLMAKLGSTIHVGGQWIKIDYNK